MLTISQCHPFVRNYGERYQEEMVKLSALSVPNRSVTTQQTTRGFCHCFFTQQSEVSVDIASAKADPVANPVPASVALRSQI